METQHQASHKTQPECDPQDFITVSKALEEFPIGRSTIYHLMYGGTLPYYQPLPRRIFINRKELIKWIVVARHAGILDLIPDLLAGQEAGAPA